MINFGPASITFGGNSIGKTYKGGSLDILYLECHPAGSSYDVVKKAYGGNGVISLFQLSGTITISESLTWQTAAELVIIMPKMKVTLFSAKLFLPTHLDVGVSTQKTFDLPFIFSKSGGNLIRLEDQ